MRASGRRNDFDIIQEYLLNIAYTGDFVLRQRVWKFLDLSGIGTKFGVGFL